LLLIEVADSSLPVDRKVKAPLYALGSIPELWIVDLEGGVLEVHRDPAPEGYRNVRRIQRGQTVRPLAFPDLEFAADDILV
jgi:Uma2 family endonuclease